MIEISVILPTRNRAHLLPFVLDGFKRQNLPLSQFEIIAVDDGSTDKTAEILNNARADLPLRLFRQRHVGLAAAKNLGIFASRGRILLFADDDDVADPDLLLNHLAAHCTYQEDEIAILGYTRLAPEVAKSPLMHHVTQVGGQLFSYGWMKPGMILPYTEFWGGRSSCKRQLLIDRGIFDPVFAFGYEDIELGWRLAPFGLRVVYEPAAISTMIRSLTFRDFCMRQQRQGYSQRTFADLHPAPEIRKYCEIDAGLGLWKKNAGRFNQYIRWVGRLDHMAEVRARAGRPIEPRDQTALDDAYRAAFMLCRAKGLATLDGAPTEFKASAVSQPIKSMAAKGIKAPAPPTVTVIVCTYNRYRHLAPLLAKLEVQNVHFSFEIVIADNSDDETAKAEFYSKTQLPAMARVLPSYPPGLSRARNVGLQAARGEYIAFIDDDTEPGPGWLGEIVAAFREFEDAAVVGGPISSIWPFDRPGWIPTKFEGCLASLNLGEEPHRLQYGYVYGANMCFRADALRAIGGFREQLGRQGTAALLSNEELQVQDELKKRGYSICYAPKAGLCHHVHEERINRGWFRRRMSWQAVSDALMSGVLSDAQEKVNSMINAADRLGIDRSFLNCFVDSNRPEDIEAQLEFLMGITTVALSTNANISAEDMAQFRHPTEIDRHAPLPAQAGAASRHDDEHAAPALHLARDGLLFFEATPGHEFLFDTFSELNNASLLTRRLDPWAEDQVAIDALFDFLDCGLKAASDHSSAIVFLTLDYWQRPYLDVGEVVAQGFKKRVLDSGLPAYAFLHRYPTDPGGTRRLQHIAPALRQMLVFSPDIKRDLESNLGLTNVAYVPLPAMIENLPPSDSASIRKRLSIPVDRVVVSLLGEARKGKGYDLVLDALAQLDTSTKQKAFFLFGGKANPELRKAAQDCLIDNGLIGCVDLRVISDKRQYIVLSDLEYRDYIQVSDVGLLIYREDQRFGMSGVLPNYVVAGKPVIATANSYIGKLVGRHGLGSLLVGETAAELARMISDAVELRDHEASMRAVAAFKPQLEKQAILARMKEILGW